MHIFHKWSKWEEYTWVGKVCHTGILVPADERGKWYEMEERRQKRKCEVCGKVQEEVIN